MTSMPLKRESAIAQKSGIERFLNKVAMLDVPGRRNVRLYSLSRQNLFLFALAVVFIGAPFTMLLGIFPFWERVVTLPAVKFVNGHIAPAIIAYDQTLESMSDLRVFTALVIAIEVLVLCNFFALLSRNVRRHALMVWLCYDRARLLAYLLLSSVFFLLLWYLFFCDLTVVGWVRDHYSARKAVVWLGVAFPISALIFGRISAIVLIGVLRNLSRLVSRKKEALWIAIARGKNGTAIS
jgi:hypothetical protein